MKEEITINLKEKTTDKSEVEVVESKVKVSKKPTKKTQVAPKKALEKKWLIILVGGIVAFLIGLGCLLFALLKPKVELESLNFPEIPSNIKDDAEYSLLTGEALAKDTSKNSPVFCIQTPNGTDGARPQSGLTEAGVIFEAIAESGITRFAAIYQNPESAVIGPVRSLRTYYLDWDTPFDCTIVHAGGAADALAAVSAGGYRNFDENYQYMYRGTYGGRLWNILFTTANYLKQFNADHGYTSSNPKSFKRMTPSEANKNRAEKLASNKLIITEPTDKNTYKVDVEVPSISVRFGGYANFNVNYTYDAETNTYNRSYASGVNHDVYKCSNENLGEKNPEDVCTLTTLSPSVVVAMLVKESKAAGGYYEDITTLGSGDVYIFQNGSVERGTWHKASKEDQIKFLDKNGNEISLIPGQTFISAVPPYGGVDF